jgi:hypothetical protein
MIDGNMVLPRITQSLQKREGFRHLTLGDSGMGKTTFTRALIAYLKSRVDVILTVDTKNKWHPEYIDPNFRVNPMHLKSYPLYGKEKENRHISFRGICYSDEALKQMQEVRPDDVASMAWDLVRLKPIQVVMNLDELGHAIRPNSQVWDGKYIAKAYREGRAVGLSVIAGTQMPQILPREAFALSDTICVFRMTSREAQYLVDYKCIDANEVDKVANLKVGEFVFLQKSVPNDGEIYKLEGIDKHGHQKKGTQERRTQSG